MKLLVYEMEQNRPRVGDEGSKSFDSRRELNYNGRRTQTAIFLRPQMYSASEEVPKYSGCIVGRREYNFSVLGRSRLCELSDKAYPFKCRLPRHYG